MEERLVSIIALCVAISGIAGLLVSLSFLEVPTFHLLQEVGDDTSMSGVIIDVQESDAVVRILVEHTCHTEVTVFNDGKTTFVVGEQVEVVGEIERYQGNRQVVAHRIDVVDSIEEVADRYKGFLDESSR